MVVNKNKIIEKIRITSNIGVIIEKKNPFKKPITLFLKPFLFFLRDYFRFLDLIALSVLIFYNVFQSAISYLELSAFEISDNSTKQTYSKQYFTHQNVQKLIITNSNKLMTIQSTLAAFQIARKRCFQLNQLIIKKTFTPTQLITQPISISDISNCSTQKNIITTASNQLLAIIYNFKILHITPDSMPQLPQVQTVRRFLQDVCLRPKPKTIKMVRAFYPNIIKQPEPSLFINTLLGQTFRQIDRYGKYLIIKFDNYSIISHLRMEGKYIWYDKKFVPEKHDHIQFLLRDGNSIVYNDVRKFGTMHLVKKGEEMNHPSLSKLGPQVNNQLTFTPHYLEESCQKYKKTIKQLLLDQEIVCGIGNIYADQILYAARVLPDRACSKLSPKQISNIVIFSKQIIDTAIQNKGTTILSFSSNHEAGSNQNILQVYGRQGQTCYNCPFKIKKIVLGGRGTHFCSKCQK